MYVQEFNINHEIEFFFLPKSKTQQILKEFDNMLYESLSYFSKGNIQKGKMTVLANLKVKQTEEECVRSMVTIKEMQRLAGTSFYSQQGQKTQWPL